MHVEITTYRKELGYADGDRTKGEFIEPAKTFDRRFGQRRDLTINAMGMTVDGMLH